MSPTSCLTAPPRNREIGDYTVKQLGIKGVRPAPRDGPALAGMQFAGAASGRFDGLDNEARREQLGQHQGLRGARPEVEVQRHAGAPVAL